jgi:glycosyltransferase involved in cell wall biosynthesis
MLGAFVWRAATARRAAVINWIQDLFPEVAEEAGVMRAAPGVAASLRRMRNEGFAHSAATVAVGHRMAERICAMGSLRAPTVIPNWADGSIVRPMEAAASGLRRELGLEGKFVAGYSGNFGRVHEFKTIVAAAALLKGDPRIRFLLIGDGNRLDGIRRAVGAHSLDNVVIAPRQPRERLSDSLAASDIHFCTLDPRFEGLVVPSKAYGIMAAGRPCIFIGDPDGEIGGLVRRERIGFNVPLGDCGGVVSIIRRLALDSGERADLGRTARAVFEREFDLQPAIRKWKSVLECARDPN